MPRERSGISYSDLAEAPGAIPKPRAKRDKAEGRTVGNSSLRTYSRLQESRTPLPHHGRPEDVDGAQCEAARMLPCVVCSAPPPSHPHHDPKVSQGGLDKDVGPLCALHHAESETMPLSRFRRKYGLNWHDVTDAVQAWMASGYPQGALTWGKG